MIYMESSQTNQLITTLVARMIFKIAPREMQLFQSQKEEYLQNPQQIINKRGYTSQVSSHEKILFLAPIIRNIVCDVIKMLESDVNEEFNIELMPQTVQFPQEKAENLYAFAYEKACQYQLSPLKAHLVAGAVLDNLIFTTP